MLECSSNLEICNLYIKQGTKNRSWNIENAVATTGLAFIVNFQKYAACNSTFRFLSYSMLMTFITNYAIIKTQYNF